MTGSAIEFHRHLGPGQKVGIKRFVLVVLRALRVLRGTPMAAFACLPWEHATRSNADDRTLNARRETGDTTSKAASVYGILNGIGGKRVGGKRER